MNILYKSKVVGGEAGVTENETELWRERSQVLKMSLSSWIQIPLIFWGLWINKFPFFAYASLNCVSDTCKPNLPPILSYSEPQISMNWKGRRKSLGPLQALTGSIISSSWSHMTSAYRSKTTLVFGTITDLRKGNLNHGWGDSPSSAIGWKPCLDIESQYYSLSFCLAIKPCPHLKVWFQ